MENKGVFNIRQQAAGSKVEIYIFGDVVDEQWWSDETSPKSVVDAIQGLDTQEIDVYIDSYGGSVAAGWGIYNALRQHTAKVRTYGVGFVASAALYPFLAGDERYASTLSAYYLHEAWTSASGYADELRRAADQIESLTDIGVNAFVERAGMERDKVLELMHEETWLTPESALELGIATALIKDDSGGPAQSARRQMIQRLTQPKQKKTNTDPEPGSSIMEMLAGIFNA
jgi:ATP-dependent Clp protease protease subunit